MDTTNTALAFDHIEGPIEYVAGFMFNDNGTKVALIKKNKPDWMVGMLNAIGGKIEDDETPMAAIIREFQEETGVTAIGWTPFCELSGVSPKGDDYIVYFFTMASSHGLSGVKTIEEEEVVVLSVNSTDGTMPNLSWFIPMAHTRLFGNDNCTYFNINEVNYKST